jgi:hypothetical protein
MRSSNGEQDGGREPEAHHDPLRVGDRHGEVERQPGEIAKTGDHQQDRGRTAGGELLAAGTREFHGGREIIGGENGTDGVEALIERIEIAQPHRDQKADRPYQHPKQPCAAMRELARRLPFQGVAENDRGRADRHKLLGIDRRRHRRGGDAGRLYQEGKSPPADEGAFLLPHPSQQQHSAENGGDRDVHGRHRVHVELHGLPPAALRARP